MRRRMARLKKMQRQAIGLPQPSTLPLPLALPTLDLLPRLSGFLGPMEEAAVAAAAATRQEDNIDRSSRVNESPAKGDKGAIAL